MPRFTLCRVDDIAELQTLGFDPDANDPARRVFVVRKDDQLYCFRNSCPHTGAPLNWQGDKFLSFDQRFIQCSLHGALFRIESGLCIAGPCGGQFLESVPFEIIDGELVVELRC